MVLEIMNSCLTHSLHHNPHLVYSLLYQREVFEPFRTHPSLMDLVHNIETVRWLGNCYEMLVPLTSLYRTVHMPMTFMLLLSLVPSRPSFFFACRKRKNGCVRGYPSHYNLPSDSRFSETLSLQFSPFGPGHSLELQSVRPPLMCSPSTGDNILLLTAGEDWPLPLLLRLRAGDHRPGLKVVA